MVVTKKVFSAGSAFPPLTPGLVRLYSMRFCPYSQRVRLALAIKQVPYEVVNVHPKRRPDWFTSDINPLGLVPCLQYDDGRIINESSIIIEYLDAVHTKTRLLPADPYAKARQLMLVDGFQRVAALFFKALKFKDAEAFNEINKILDSYEKLVKVETFFGGPTSIGIIDVMIFPWFERIDNLQSLTNSALSAERFPKLTRWYQKMRRDVDVAKTLSDAEQMLEYYKSTLSKGGEELYDVGLDGEEDPPKKKEEAEEEAKNGEEEKKAES